MTKIKDLEFLPLTSERWTDFEKLFGERGACGGCWCMWWRLIRSEFMKQKGEGNKKAMKRLVDSGEVPGIMAYCDDKPVGWCSIAPRRAFLALEHSRVLKQVDDEPVWSAVCFFIAKPFRRKGVSIRLLEAAVEYAKKHRGKIIEGYPVEPHDKQPDAFMYTGLASAFHSAGFREVARRSKTRPIMRYIIEEGQNSGCRT